MLQLRHASAARVLHAGGWSPRSATVPSAQQACLRQSSYNWTRLCPCVHDDASGSGASGCVHKSAHAGTALRGGEPPAAAGAREIMSRSSVRRAGNHVVLPVLLAPLLIRRRRFLHLLGSVRRRIAGAPRPLPVVSASLRRHTVECRCLATCGRTAKGCTPTCSSECRCSSSMPGNMLFFTVLT